MQCDQCGARRPRSGPCPECGAPPPGTFSSMRQWRDQSRTGEGPAAGGGRGGSGANWGAGASGSGRRGSGANWGAGGAGRSSSRWDEGEDYDDYDDRPAGRSNPRNAAPRRRASEYEEVDLERALVPAHNEMLPMDPAMGGMGGLPAVPGLPATDEEERMLGIRRPVYIPANSEKRKRKLGTWRVLSGVLSVMLVCIASCALAGVFGQSQIRNLISPKVGIKTNNINATITGVPVTPVATPGPQGKYVSQIVTAGGRSSNGTPTNVKTHFLVGDYVNVVAVIRGLPKGSHVISVAWYLNNVFLELPAGAQTSLSIDGEKSVVFALQYSASGLGAAKIYIDRPANDTSDDLKDPALADVIYFAVEMPTPAPTVGTGTPGTKTPVASPTATTKKP